MSDIFISYASEDKNRVKALAQALEKKGWSVWWDRRIPIGRSFDEVIEEAVDASKAVVVVWTKTSVKSQWVKNEAREGLRRRVLFPVMLLEEVKIPLEFRDVQAAHLMDWQPEQDHDGFDRFIDDLAGVIGVPSNTVVQPPPVTQAKESSSTPTRLTAKPETESLQGVVRPVLEGNNNLSALKVSPGSLSPAFSANTLNYTVDVGSNVNNVTVSATKADPNIVISGDVSAGAGVATGHAAIQLRGPGTTILTSITVTAPNGSSKSYLITVNRAGQSTESLPYLPIGIGILAVIGVLAYFAFSSQSPSPMSAKTIIGKDGAPMVLIPSGSFQMGSTKDEVERAVQTCIKEYEIDQQTCEGWYRPELPQHQVSLDAFYLDKYEVTNRLFQQFVQQTGYRTTAEEKGSAGAFVEGKDWEEVKGANWRKPENGVTVFDSNRAGHPVVSVSWDDAQAYCRGAGKRLPTEAEWEYAARAGTTTRYWWGDGNPGARRVENIADEAAKNLLNVIMSGYNDGAVRTAPGGSYETNPWGLYDISGNAAEWTADWYDENYYSQSTSRNPKGPSNGEYRVLRGGSWFDDPDDVRSAARHLNTPSNRKFKNGFRCAQDVPK